jgi:mono/diheme cytochrome c family protein
MSKPTAFRLMFPQSVATAALCLVVLSCGARQAKAQQQPAAPESRTAPSGDAAAGQALFTGQKPLQNGGPACGTCHGIANLSVPHGPTPGADLTHEYSKLGPESLEGLLTQPPFPPMDELYKKSPLTPGERQDLIAFLKRESEAKPAETAVPTASPSPKEIAAGEGLFSGGIPMRNGGPACITCHTAAGTPFPYGGTMGPDLTKEYSKLGPQGIAIALKTLYFPAMNPLFKHRPLTANERKQLAAFFQSIDQRPPPPSPTVTLLLASLVVLAGLFLWTWLAVGRRRVRSVRQALLERAGMSKGNR